MNVLEIKCSRVWLQCHEEVHRRAGIERELARRVKGI